MTSKLDCHHIHLTGFKGVAMASIAQCLHDKGVILSGSDVAEDFVTKDVLQQVRITSHIGFSDTHIPDNTELLIYTAAHEGPHNPEVIAAQQRGIAIMSQAEALGELFNTKRGIAVCGVGGKSTTSAMLAWIFSKLHIPISYSVGVGSIAGLSKTGQWDKNSEYFVAEADEYVIDPSAARRGEKITPRFSFLQPEIIVCTSLAFDHPDVYKDFEHTKQTFLEFFLKVKKNGVLIVHGDQKELVELAHAAKKQRTDISLHTYGEEQHNELVFGKYTYQQGALTTIIHCSHVATQHLPLQLRVPGKHNLLNACATLLACTQATISLEQASRALFSFHSTKRRFELKGEHNKVLYYDDYAHHPRELKLVIETLQQMYPQKAIYVIFQPHTFSRTKALFGQFVEVLGTAPHLVLTDIFASAREQFDPTVSSKLLAQHIAQKFPGLEMHYLPSLEEVTQFCLEKIPQDSVCMTVGAGDIYTIYDKMDLTQPGK